MMDALDKFQKQYPTRKEKEKALSQMSNKEIDELIACAGTPQGKAFYKKYKK